MHLTASDLYTFFRPSKCSGRVYLKHRGEREGEPSPYEEILRKLGERHERSHLQTFPTYADLSSGEVNERESRTKEEIKKRTPVLYHPLLRGVGNLGGIKCEILGEPDFLILEENTYGIRDSKISRRITEKDHPEILLQVGLYGWLFQQMFYQEPRKLEVLSGTGDIVLIPYDGGASALDALREILALKQMTPEPYSPVGWTKCGGCPFNHRCWPEAENRRDVALIAGVDQGLAIALRQKGIITAEEFLSAFKEESLAEFKRPWGKSTQRVGKRAGGILRMANSLVSGKEIFLQVPNIPQHPNYVMFDLEGLPPHLDELEKIYLWGLQVFGREASDYTPALAGFGNEGDRDGWNDFLEKTENIFKKYGDIPFVHWHHYERVRLDMYVDRYGDTNGTAARVRNNLLDLLPVCQASIALPLPSYSLKVVERYINFKRTQEEFGGEWAMAKYIEATEMQEEEARDAVVEEIKKYNREDLEATWAVMQWLKSKR